TRESGVGCLAGAIGARTRQQLGADVDGAAVAPIEVQVSTGERRRSGTATRGEAVENAGNLVAAVLALNEERHTATGNVRPRRRQHGAGRHHGNLHDSPEPLAGASGRDGVRWAELLCVVELDE